MLAGMHEEDDVPEDKREDLTGRKREAPSARTPEAPSEHTPEEPSDRTPGDVAEGKADETTLTPDEFIRRYLAELEALEEKRKQDAIARRLAKLPEWIRRNG